MSPKTKTKAAGRARHSGRVTTPAPRRCSNSASPSWPACRFTSSLLTDPPTPVCSWCGRGMPVDPALAAIKKRARR